MRTYTATTGVIFALLAVSHVWRMYAESSAHLERRPEYIIITLVAAGLSVWAMLILRRRTPAS